MPGSQLALAGLRVRGRAFDAGAQEAFEILDLQFWGFVFVDFGLVFGEEVESCRISWERLNESTGFLLFLRNRITLEIHLESMGGFYRPFGGRVNRTFDVGVLSLVNCCEDVKVAFPVFLLPVTALAPSICRGTEHTRVSWEITAPPFAYTPAPGRIYSTCWRPCVGPVWPWILMLQV